MISATTDPRGGIEKLRLWREGLRARLRETFADGAETLLASVRAKLSGELLQTKSGALRASVRAEVDESSHGLAARLWSDGSVPYARVQEYGGRIAIPEIVARNAQALAFVYSGKMMFAKSVAAHIVAIPERSYMRSSLAEFAPAFLDDIRKLATEAAR